MAPSFTLFCGALLSASALHAVGTVAAPGTFSLDFHRRDHDDPAVRLRRRQDKTATEALVYEGQGYYVNITIGTPPQKMAVLLDTGSSDLWVPSLDSDVCTASRRGCGANGGFSPKNSNTYDYRNSLFQIAYADNSKLIGDYALDNFTMNGVSMSNVLFGLALKGQASTPSGILGVGYDTHEASTQLGLDPYPNIVDDLVVHGIINSRSYSLYLNDIKGQGTILFGGVDSAKYTGDLGIIDILPNADTNQYDTFTVVLSKMAFAMGGSTSNINLPDGGLPVVLDSGTTLTYVPDDVATAVYQGLGVTLDGDNGPLIACNADTSNANFAFTFGGTAGVTIQVNLGQFIIPVPAAAGLPKIKGSQACIFGLQSIGNVPNAGGTYLFGDTFLRSAYVVYDLDNAQVGIAQTKFNAADSNVQAIGSSPTQTVNTIPGASTVTAQASLSQTNTGLQYPGFDATTDVGNSAASAPTTTYSATFAGISGGALGTTSATGSGASSTHKGAAGRVRVLPFDVRGVTACGFIGLAGLMAGAVLVVV